MTSLRAMFIILIVTVGLVLAVGCVGEQASGNSNTNSTAFFKKPNQPICPPQVTNAKPYIIINPVNTTHYVDEVFEINGTTNFDIDKKIKLTFDEPRFGGPFPGIIHYNFTDSEGYVKIRGGDCGTNFWSYTINLSGFHPKLGYAINVFDQPNLTVVNYTLNIHVEPAVLASTRTFSGMTSPPVPLRQCIKIDAISDHRVGDVFVITGTTSFPMGKRIKITIEEPCLFGPGSFNAIQYYNYSGSVGYIKIQYDGRDINYWSYEVNLAGFHPALYSVKVFDESAREVFADSSFSVRRG